MPTDIDEATLRQALSAVDGEPTIAAAQRVAGEAEHARKHSGKYASGYNAGVKSRAAGDAYWLEYCGRIRAQRDAARAVVAELVAAVEAAEAFARRCAAERLQTLATLSELGNRDAVAAKLSEAERIAEHIAKASSAALARAAALLDGKGEG